MKDTSVIPHGHYCYDESGTCPYHGFDESLPEQENGTCKFLQTNDWEINGGDKESDIIDIKGNKLVWPKEYDEKTGKLIHFPQSLLWDLVKECDENMESDYEKFE